MGVDDLAGLFKERDFADDLIAALTVLTHNFHFVRVKLAGLEEDGVGCGDLADVMEECSASDDAEFFRVEAQFSRQLDSVSGDAAGVPFGFGVAQIKRVAHGFKGDVVAAFQLLHGGAKTAGAGADDLFEVLAVGDVLLAEATVVYGAGDDGDQLGSFKGLEKVVDCAAAKGVGGHVEVMDGRKDDDGGAGVIDANAVEECEAIGLGHHDVGYDEIVVRAFLEECKGRGGTVGGGSGIAISFQKGGDDVAYGSFIVDDEDSFLHVRGYRRGGVGLEGWCGGWKGSAVELCSIGPSFQ